MVTTTGSTLMEKGAAILAATRRRPSRSREQGGALAGEIAKLALMGEDSADAIQGQAGRCQARRLGRPDSAR